MYLSLLALRNTTDKILGSLAQRMLSKRTKTALPIAKHLLKPAPLPGKEVKAHLKNKRETKTVLRSFSSTKRLPILSPGECVYKLLRVNLL